MYNVKIITGGNSDNMFRQLPNGQNISKCGRYRFFIDEDIKDPDFLVVRNKYICRKTDYTVAPQNTLLLISEPTSIIRFPKSYCRQFAMMSTCQEGMNHPNAIYHQANLPWFVGINDKGAINPKTNVTYDSLKNAPFPEKNKIISVITSNKSFTKGHQDRIDFVAKLKEYNGNKIDIFGRGFNDFEDKWDVLAPYKYHIAIENSSSNYYWTEKLSDCYLTGTFPIYYGCKNIADYFPQNSYKEIDIHDFDAAIKIIDKVISEDSYFSSIKDLEKSKNLVLDEYNIFDHIVDCCNKMNPDAKKQCITFHPANTMLNIHNLYYYTIGRNLFKAINFFKSTPKKVSKGEM